MNPIEDIDSSIGTLTVFEHWPNQLDSKLQATGRFKTETTKKLMQEIRNLDRSLATFKDARKL